MPARLESRFAGMSFFVAALLGFVPAQADPLSGPPSILDGSHLVVSGQAIMLDGIAVPAPGETCVIRDKTMDCGSLARAGLMDITAGASVTCTKASASTYRCRADGYDIGYGQIHAGWAVALDDAPEHYHHKMQDARQNERGLWAAKTPESEHVFALTLKR